MHTSSFQPSVFEQRIDSLAQTLARAWSTLLQQSPAGTPVDAGVQARIQQLQPRSLEEGLAAQELGWAWADGAGFVEWDDSFLARLAVEGLQGQFLSFLMQLRKQDMKPAATAPLALDRIAEVG